MDYHRLGVKNRSNQFMERRRIIDDKDRLFHIAFLPSDSISQPSSNPFAQRITSNFELICQLEVLGLSGTENSKIALKVMKATSCENIGKKKEDSIGGLLRAANHCGAETVTIARAFIDCKDKGSRRYRIFFQGRDDQSNQRPFGNYATTDTPSVRHAPQELLAAWPPN
jgi:hypothetical protein